MPAPRWTTLCRTALSLGPANIARVVLYKARLRTGTHPVQRLQELAAPQAPFFADCSVRTALQAPAWEATGGLAFGWHKISKDEVPDWHSNLFTSRRAANERARWWTLPDFDTAGEDVKGVWELSRLDWVMTLAQYAARGEADALVRLNQWLESWSVANPPYRGHNWKCAQEASIRVMHLAIAAMILDQAARSLPALITLIRIHAERIAPTIAYAKGQDNNHGTSEAVALFIAGTWLTAHGVPAAGHWERLGRRLLSERVAHLIATDGTFSQYSATYHRLVLDTLSVAECWRRHLDVKPFDRAVLDRAGRAVEWLRTLVDPVGGDAPNLGANDGANLLRLTDAGYRDFRPSVQLAAALFTGTNPYPSCELAHEQLAWLNVELPKTASVPRRSQLLDAGGLAVLHDGDVMAVLRFPRFQFRPAHADALHVDLWRGGKNFLRDGGSFMYAAEAGILDTFAGASGHNGIQFDGRQQMPRLGRFLWGDWLQTRDLGTLTGIRSGGTFWASYVDGEGVLHRREIKLSGNHLQVTDRIAGFAKCALLRWRLLPGEWRLDEHTATCAEFRISVRSDIPLQRLALADGWESRFYGVRSTLPVLEAEVRSAATLITDVEWPA